MKIRKTEREEKKPHESHFLTLTPRRNYQCQNGNKHTQNHTKLANK